MEIVLFFASFARDFFEYFFFCFLAQTIHAFSFNGSFNAIFFSSVTSYTVQTYNVAA